jgi:hypothetical protein
LKGELNGFLQQASAESYEFPRTCRVLLEMHGLIDSMRAQLAKATNNQLQAQVQPSLGGGR